MGIFSKLFGTRGSSSAVVARSIEDPNVPLDDEEMIDALCGGDGAGGVSESGVRVSPERALKLSPVWRGVFLVANTVAKLPLYVYERDADGEGKHYATKHAAYRLLRRKPCPEVNPFTWMQVITAKAILDGNGYAWIERRNSGDPLALWPLPMGTVHPVRVDGVLWYVYTPGGNAKPVKMRAEDVYHIKGPGLDGLVGMSLAKKGKQSIGAGMAAQEYSARYFSNGAEPRVIFESPNKLTDVQRQQIKAMWQQMHAGLENAHKSGILEHGVTIKAFGSNPEDSQLLETRKFTAIDVANWLHVPPHKLGETSRQGYSSLEQENQAFLDDSIEPWLVQHEQESYDKLLTEEQKASESHTVEFMRLALMRIDAAARSAFYHNAKIDGWMNDDEIRARENLNPKANGQGKTYYRPLNMVPEGQEQAEKDKDFAREAWLGFQADGTVADVAANLTDLKALTAAVGLPVNDEYTEPYLPVIAEGSGPLVSGDVVTDPEGDIVGGDTLPGGAGGAGGGPGEDKGEPKPGAGEEEDETKGAGERAGRAAKTPAAGSKGRRESAEARHAMTMLQLRTATRQMMLDAVGRMIRRLRTHAVKAARAGTLSEFLAGGIDEHRAVLVETIGPALAAAGAARRVVPSEARLGLLVDGLIADVRRRVRASDGTAASVEAALATSAVSGTAVA